MKLKLLFLALIFTTTIFSQGIAVQGIARNNTDSAIINKNLTFTFTLVRGNSNVYSETESITTDGYGVFSHILGNGLTSGDSFSSIDFSEENLILKISVTYDDSTHAFFEKFLSSTPYAYHAKNADRAVKADNGVPTGAIMPYAGSFTPDGWLKCDGSPIPSQYTDLREMFKAHDYKTPNLRGRVLKGTGTSGNPNYVGPPLRDFQADQNKSHKHNSGTLNGTTTGDSKHTHSLNGDAVSFEGGGSSSNGADGKSDKISKTDEDGAHIHDVDINGGSTDSQGGNEARVASYGVNYIIKI